MSRSFLFVPADSERKLAKAQSAGADALILDLEDSVIPENRPRARELAREFLGSVADQEVWIRINPLQLEDALSDLRATVRAKVKGIVLPKPTGAEDANRLAKLLDVLEQEHELEPESVKILPIATERPEAMFRLYEYASATRRIAAMTWGAEDLSSALGATANRDSRGKWLPPYEFARTLCLYAASAAGVPAIDTVFTDFRDTNGLGEAAADARRDGFAGMLAIHPDQVDVINAAFVPSAEEVRRARSIVSLFVENPDSGVLQLDGEMLDRPHLVQARKILTMADRSDTAKTRENEAK